MRPHTRRTVAAIGAVVTALFVWSVLAPIPVGTAGASPLSAVDCQSADEGSVFVTDSGLAVHYHGQSVDDNPFVNDTTLAFPNVTVRATDTASLRVVPADDGTCLRALTPTNASITVASDAGPTVVVDDPLVALRYGPFAYAPSSTGPDLAYNATAPASVTVRDGSLSAGRTVAAVDAATDTRLATGPVTNGTVTLRLPAGDRRVDLRYVPPRSETATPTPTATPPDTDPVVSPPDSTAMPTATTIPPATTRTVTTATRTTTTPNATTTRTTTAENASAFRVPAWTGELVAYEPSPQTQHVGGLLPLTLSLWALAGWIVVVRRGPDTRLLALVLAVASLRATSDLAQVLLDGFVGVEASLASLNLLLEFSTAALFAGFAVQYAALDAATVRRARRGLGAVAGAGVAAILTNPLHGQVFSAPAVATGPFTYVTASVGPVGWLLFALTLGLIAGGGVLVGRTFVAGTRRGAWRPVAVIGTGLVVAVGVAALDALELGPVTGYDYSAVGVNYFVLATTVSLLGYGFQRLKPSGQRSIVADLDDAIVVLDDAWRVVEWNDAAEHLAPTLATGRSFDAVLSTPLPRPQAGQTVTREMSLHVDRSGGFDHADDDGATPPTDEADADERPMTDGSGGPPTAADTSRQGPDAADPLVPGPVEGGTEQRHFIVSARTVMTETNDVIGYTVRFADVTALKRHMMELERKNDQLDQFAGAVTRDLRGPLSAARDETSEVIDVLESADSAGSVDRRELTAALSAIDDALERMASLVEDILGLARDDERQADPEQVAFAETVEAVWDRVDAPEAAFVVEADGTIEADPDHLDRLLAVLVRNAVEHGGDDVTVRVALDADGFTVTDDGPGVPRAIRDRAFEAGVTTAESAAGLGLTMARQRARAHDWTITLDDTAAGARVAVRDCETSLSTGGAE